MLRAVPYPRARELVASLRAARCLALGALLALGACAQGATSGRPAQGLRFEGSGRLLVVFDHARTGRELVLVERGGARRVEIPAFREVRFAAPDLLVLVLEAPAPDDSGLPATQLALHDLLTASTRRFGPVGRHYDLEPSPDGRYLAVGAERADLGDSDLEIWSLEGDPELLASRPQSLEEPRWRDDGQAIAVALLMQDPEGDDELGGGFGGHALSWPRLHRLRRDLGAPALIFDGAEPGTLAVGGSLPLWWDARGLFARQRAGLVRCDAAQGGCALVFPVEESRRVVDGRPVGPREVWLLTVAASDAFDRREPDAIVRIDLESGAVLSRWRAPPGVAVVDLDWVGP